MVKRDMVLTVAKNVLNAYKIDASITNNGRYPYILFPNGSMIKIMHQNSWEMIRGIRFYGAIIDTSIDQETVDSYIMSQFVPYSSPSDFKNSDCKIGFETHLKERMFYKEKIFYCNIGESDVIKSDQMNRQLIYVSSAYSKDDLLDSLLYSYQKKNQDSFRREYMCMWENNTYDHPVVEKELNGNKVLLYEAWGIPKGLIEYSTEFVNKTKQTYLNINGEYKIEEIGFENDINVHLEIDTNIYDGYEVHIEDGLITVTLHEIKNEIPILKDYGVI